MELKDLAQSEYYGVYLEDMTKELEALKQPSDEPIRDLTEANVMREKILWLQSKINQIKRLRVQTDDKPIDDSYE